MPRAPNGTYTLPAGNPVVSGTPISSSVQNTTMTDVATALTDSLSRSGLGGMLAPLPFLDGTAAAPAITFTTEPTTGIYRPGAGQWAISILGAQVVLYNGSSASPANTVQFAVSAQQMIGGLPYAITNIKADYTGSNAIVGQWDFTYNGVTFKGPQIVGKGGMLFNDGAAQTSGAIRLVASAPAPGSGKPGDIWFVV